MTVLMVAGVPSSLFADNTRGGPLAAVKGGDLIFSAPNGNDDVSAVRDLNLLSISLFSLQLLLLPLLSVLILISTQLQLLTPLPPVSFFHHSSPMSKSWIT